VVVKRDAGGGWIVPNEVLRKELRLEHEEHGEHVASYATEEPLTYEVYADDRNGLRRLASGQDVAPTSLTISGNTISWTQGGKRFSAPLL
jgi:hypothetical protein